jgi:hypothetical protein
MLTLQAFYRGFDTGGEGAIARSLAHRPRGAGSASRPAPQKQRPAARAGGEGGIATRRLTASSCRWHRVASVTAVPRPCRANPRREFCIPPVAKTQKARCGGPLRFGGEGGIRTRGGL